MPKLRLQIVRNDFYSAGQRLLKEEKVDIVIVERFDRQPKCPWCHVTVRDKAVAKKIMRRTGWIREDLVIPFVRFRVGLSEEKVRQKLEELGF